MNASMLLDHINVHVHLVMNYSPVESAKVKKYFGSKFSDFQNVKNFNFFRIRYR